jgi:hypothetical protein
MSAHVCPRGESGRGMQRAAVCLTTAVALCLAATVTFRETTAATRDTQASR